jgi:L-ribulose-5-phosphate 3-epimerase
MNLCKKVIPVPKFNPLALGKACLLISVLAWLTAAPALVRAFGSANLQVRFGVCDWTIGKGGDPAAFELARKLGLEGVQVSLNPAGDSLALISLELQKTFLKAAATNSIAIASFAIGELNNVPLKSDPRAEKWLAQGIDIAGAMGVRRILVPFFGKGDLRKDVPGTEAVIACLKRLAPKAEQKRVILALESWLSAEEHLKIIERVGSPAVRVYYDVGNAKEEGYDVSKEIRLLGKHICEIHAKDYKDLYGKGSVDFAAVREAMEGIGYRGWLVLEGTKLPLGVEKSIAYDLNFLRGVFSAPGKEPLP